MPRRTPKGIEDKVCKLYKDTNYTLKKIANICNIAESTVLKILKRKKLSGKRKLVISEEVKNMVCELYKTTDLSLRKIAEVCGINCESVSLILARVGLRDREKKKCITKGELQKMCELYATGDYTFAELAKMFGYDSSVVRRRLTSLGYSSKPRSELSRKYWINEEFFDIVDTEEKAYFLGLLYADGCNHSNYVSICLREEDKYILEKFRDLVCPEKPLCKCKHSKYGWSDQYCLYLNSKYMCRRLEELGVVKRKTFKLKFPDWLDSNLYNHFIRGYFDGDGSICICKANYDQPSFSMCGKKDFLEKVGLILVEEIGLGKVNLYKSGSIYSLSYAGRRVVLKIRDWLYKNATIYLKRKYEKFYSIPERI